MRVDAHHQKIFLGKKKCTILFFFRFSFATCLFNTVSVGLGIIRILKSMVWLDNNDRFSRILLLILERIRLFEDLVVDDPVIVDNSTVLTSLTAQHAHKTLIF